MQSFSIFFLILSCLYSNLHLQLIMTFSQYRTALIDQGSWFENAWLPQTDLEGKLGLISSNHEGDHYIHIIKL